MLHTKYRVADGVDMSLRSGGLAVEGKRILVTGAGSGIGAALVERLVGNGAIVAALDIDGDRAASVAERLNRQRVRAIACDVSDEESVAGAVDEVVHWVDGLDGCVANAGVQLIGRDAPVHELQLDVFERTIETNVRGTFLTCKHAARTLIDGGGGSIVLMGSPTGLIGQGRGFTAYSMSKASVFGLARVMAADLAEHGIRVNTVVPGFTRTPLVSGILEDPDELTRTLAHVPLGRPGTTQEIAAVVEFLLGDSSSYVTGGVYAVDGGMTAV